MNPAMLTQADRALANSFAGELEAANEVPPMLRFIVLFRRPGCWPRTMDVMAVDSLAAVTQHEDLCRAGERIEAVTPARWDWMQGNLNVASVEGSPAYHRAVSAQRPSELDMATWRRT